jgi:hypothetical protein
MSRSYPDDLHLVRPTWQSRVEALLPQGPKADLSDGISHARMQSLLSGSQAALRHTLAFRHMAASHRIASQRPHYNPNQPRVPAGHSDGGQWTSDGRGSLDVVDARERATFLRSGPVASDASPDPLGVWSQYAEAANNNNAPDPAIERTRQTLYGILVRVNAEVASRRDPLSPNVYGIRVHAEFANAVRARNLPGIGKAGVEQSFDAEGLARYGLDGSIRTDVILRNEAGKIIAIYDVKTGKAAMRPAREAEIRDFTKVGPDVPVIILHAVRPQDLR